MILCRKLATGDAQRLSHRDKFARNACTTLLCLLYLVSNSAVLPSLSLGKGCHCSHQVQEKSECCCFNKTLGNKNIKLKSFCSSEKRSKRSCCSDQKEKQPTSQTNSKRSQFTSLCGCCHSAKEGLHSTIPRDLNPSPTLLTPDGLTIPFDFTNVSPVTLDCAPDTPPPQNVA